MLSAHPRAGSAVRWRHGHGGQLAANLNKNMPLALAGIGFAAIYF
jgi:hypothetical protein